MNKQELIKHYEDMSEKLHVFPIVAISRVLEDLWKLNEQKKPVVKQFVDDYIKHAKEKDWDLQDLFEFVGDEDRGGLREWFYDGCNQETLALAWIFGYEVMEEKWYLVKMKGIEGHNSYLKYNKNLKHWYFGSLFIYNNDVDTRTYHTRKELEESGFGWVFDCEGIEVKEVE